MIYDEPVFRRWATPRSTSSSATRRASRSISASWRSTSRCASTAPRGLVETNPQVRTLGLVFDPLATTRARIVAHVKELIAAQDAVSTLPSRRVIIPAFYDDPWSRECAEAFGVRNNIEYIAEFNDMPVPQVIETHTGCDYWVTGVGFVPGAFMSYAMDPGKRLRRTALPHTPHLDPRQAAQFRRPDLHHLSDPRAGRRPALRPHPHRDIRPEGVELRLRRRPGARPRRRPSPL